MNDTLEQVEKEVRATVEAGVDIYENVRSITLKALTERTLDIDNIKTVLNAVLKGMNDGISPHYGPARDAFQQTVEALDDTLDKTAEASKLAIEEASANYTDFSQHDFQKAAEDLKSLEGLFFDTLETVARQGNEAAVGIVRDFLEHARRNGTAVGKTSQLILENLGQMHLSGQKAVFAGAAATTSALAKIAGGILSGIAERLSSNKYNK